jgi:hypothetical protein
MSNQPNNSETPKNPAQANPQQTQSNPQTQKPAEKPAEQQK